MKKFFIYFGIIIALLLIFARVTMGVYVVHPMGAIPEGKTVVYWRIGSDLDFIETPETYTKKHFQTYSLLTKALGIAKVADHINDETIILRLDYYEFLEEKAE